MHGEFHARDGRHRVQAERQPGTSGPLSRSERDDLRHQAQTFGLYRPETEHGACGLGFIASLRNQRSHKIVRDALQIVANLEHRGACGCDPDTSDGVGILLQTPDRFLRSAVDFQLPDLGEYACGVAFLPTDAPQRRKVEDMIETFTAEEGQEFLGWRDVPRDPAAAGPTALAVEPVIRQFFIGRGPGPNDVRAFERKLFVIRKRVERAVRESGISQASYFHVPSLSPHTLAYKGLLLADRFDAYFTDLKDPAVESAFGLVHQRFSTNTMPTWDLAQPFRFLCHNGEINTLRGNINWMHARERVMSSPLFEDVTHLLPIATPGASDSAVLDNVLELLYHTGRSLPHCVAMLIPEAWEKHDTMSDAKRAFYEYHSCLMEPWDGPAALAFTDGTVIGATLDRNGFRPARYTVTKDGFVVLASETGVLDIDPANVLYKERLQPGKMFVVNLAEGRVVPDGEIKESLAARRPYRSWLNWNMIRLTDIPNPKPGEYPGYDFANLDKNQRAFGYTREDLRVLLEPMGRTGGEPLGSMGNDAPLAVLSERQPLLYDYFKQLFAQVTNPPLDAIREELVTSTATDVGPERDLFEETELHCRQLRIENLVLTNKSLKKIQNYDDGVLRSKTLHMLYPVAEGGAGLRQALDTLCAEAAGAVEQGYSILILSDRGVTAELAAIPALLASAAVHHHLIRARSRTLCGVIVESAEPREVHHFAMLVAFGVGSVNPYLALASLADLHRRGEWGDELTLDEARGNYARAVNKGVVKVISKMGISTLDGYRGAQIVEAVGLHQSVIDAYFPGTSSRIGGIGLDEIAAETAVRHARGFPPREIAAERPLDAGGKYQWRRDGEHHLNNPLTIATLQQAVRDADPKTFAEFCRMTDDQSRQACTLRGLIEFKPADKPVPLEEVEPAAEIVKRFKTGAMSFGSLSFEAHANLAIAMNRIGGKSNSGEGGEDPLRYDPIEDGDPRRAELARLSPWTATALDNGDSMRSAIKQVASGRFGVTSAYLNNADEIQIKMAQGAKPGEGGQLPGYKVDEWIGRVRHSTPGVGLISPPPHHDIYSIEDLAQLIHDLKNANDRARINVKLVSEVGVGTIAAGVAKAKADVVLISGHDGGTGASPLTSIKHTGLPWELGLAETQQVLVMNDLRSRITVEVDGQLRTGRDVAIACLLGAEEFGFATAPLIASGCIMMRKCHLNTCPVGIATQDPELRRQFTGKPEHVVNYMFFVAEEMRKIMATLGMRTVGEMIGCTDRLDVRPALNHWKTKGLDLSAILHTPEALRSMPRYRTQDQDHELAQALDATTLLRLAEPAIERGERVFAEVPIRNVNRTVGAMTGSALTRRYGSAGLPEDTLHFKFHGSAGQSFGAFAPSGMTLEIEGDANDYFGKGLSGGKLIVYPPKASTFQPRDSIVIGNVAFYGATAGEAYVRGLAGERFCVRNSGAQVVVEGVGDHGCEYMTGGCVAILGATGRNFAAGMSGGIAYVLDLERNFAQLHCNPQTVEVEPLVDPADIAQLRGMIERYVRYTDSPSGRRIFDRWDEYQLLFVKVMPTDYKRALEMRTQQDARNGRLPEVVTNG